MVYLRFYEELNDFLPEAWRKTTFAYPLGRSTSIKDLIESLGVPHPEVDLVLVNGESVDFSYRVREGDRISVYPVFESLDIGSVQRLRPIPLREPRFVVDNHLGKLTRYLRLLGFDTLYINRYARHTWTTPLSRRSEGTSPEQGCEEGSRPKRSFLSSDSLTKKREAQAEDAELARISAEESRILLTRDRNLLKRAIITRGYWVRSADPRSQIREILDRFDLRGSVRPFCRCLVCNGLLQSVPKAEVFSQLPPRVRLEQEEFYRCSSCGKVYWPGSHCRSMNRMLEELL